MKLSTLVIAFLFLPGLVSALEYYQTPPVVFEEGLENFRVTSGGKQFSAVDVFKLYDDLHLQWAEFRFNRPGRYVQHESDRWTSLVNNIEGKFIAFTDDDGQAYAAAIKYRHRNGNKSVFDIKRIDPKKTLETLNDNDYSFYGAQEVARNADAGFRLISPDKNLTMLHMTREVIGFRHAAFDAMTAFNRMLKNPCILI